MGHAFVLGMEIVGVCFLVGVVVAFVLGVRAGRVEKVNTDVARAEAVRSYERAGFADHPMIVEERRRLGLERGGPH